MDAEYRQQVSAQLLAAATCQNNSSHRDKAGTLPADTAMFNNSEL
jgi:hypothetical protein